MASITIKRNTSVDIKNLLFRAKATIAEEKQGAFTFGLNAEQIGKYDK
jgi:hypothetical protein